MLFDRSDDGPNERILYKSKPNILFGCKKAIYGFVLLVIVLMLSPMAIKFIGKMQVYLISHVELPLTRYAAIAFFVVILFIIIYIIWQLLGWYSKEYIITDTRVIVQSGVLSTKKNYMPYAKIQDINSSQTIIGKAFKIGTISLFSAYDNNSMQLANISDVSEVEEIIFTNMVNSRPYHDDPRRFPPNRGYDSFDDRSMESDDYYDEFEPITPIGREKDSYSRRNYEYYPEDFGYNERRKNNYEYESFDARSQIRYGGASDSHSQDRDDYYGRDYYEVVPDEIVEEDSRGQSVSNESGEEAIKRHFDKFKR
jgi:membrane protein YdbS with pleckstrin-like domain